MYNNNNIFITGFMGSGKTTVGKALAKKLNRKFIDLDSAIETFLDQSISDVIEKFGEEYFRKIENQQLALLCKEAHTVISLGGGSLINEKNQAQIKKSGTLIYLMTEEKTLMGRLETSHSRPLLNKNKDFSELFNERKFGYTKANLCIRTDDGTPEQVADIILSEIRNL